jgi:RNA polymerase sigma-70 factor (ECF subfamily)
VVAAVRRPIEGARRVASLLSRLATLHPPIELAPLWVNGAPAARFDLDGALDTVTSVVVEDGRITRIYAIRNPHKLGRMDREAALSR